MIRLANNHLTSGLFALCLILFCLPRLLSVPFGNGQLYYSLALLLLAVPFLSRKSIAPYILLLGIVPSLIFHELSVSVTTVGYYYIAMVLSVTRISIDDRFYRGFHLLLANLIGLTILLDFLNPEFLDLISSGERTLDQRTQLGFIRPVGFFRESSEMGIVLATAAFVTFREQYVGLSRFYIGLLMLSQSFLGLILLGVLFAINRVISWRVISVAVIAILALYLPRLISIYAELSSVALAEWFGVNLSIVKRLVHPVLGLTTVYQNMEISNLVFGLSPGSVSSVVSREWSQLLFSDLSEGYILNSVFNIFANFGLLGLVVYLFTLRIAGFHLRDALCLVSLMFCGMAFLHAAFVLLNLYPKRAE